MSAAGLPVVAEIVRSGFVEGHHYGSIVALAADGLVDWSVGEVVALVGDNGAGKSTLAKMVSGVLTPDSGFVELDGEPVTFHGPADARDAAQETFVAAWRQLPRLRAPEKFEAWLQRVAVNAARQTHRARSRRRIREIPSSTVVALADRAAGEAPDDAAILDAALATLPVEQRAILVLHHLEGRPLAELAAILDIPEGTAKSRLFTARGALAAAIRADEA